MKRKLFFFTMGSLLFGFVLFIPYWTGVEAEKQFRLLNQQYPTHDARVVLSDTTYQRGWLFSQAQSTFEIERGVISAESQNLILRHKIEHGFLPIYPTVIYTTVAPQSKIVSWLGLIETPVMVKTILQLDGSGKSEMHTLPITLDAPDKPAKLTVQSMTGSAAFASNFTQLTGELHLPQVQLETKQGKVQFHDTQFTTNLRAHTDDLWLGLTQWRMAEADLISRNLPAVALRQVNLSVDNQLVDKNLQINLKLQLQQLAAKQDNYGPGDIAVELRHLNVNSVNNIRQILNTMSNLPSAQTNILLWAKLTQHGTALLNEQPELVIPQLNFTTPQGQVSGNLQLGVDKIDATAWLYPLTLLDSFHGKLALQLPKSLFNQILASMVQPTSEDSETTDVTEVVQSLIANWLKRGWMTQQDQTYHVQAQLQGGMLDLNGRQIMLKNLLR